MLILKPAAYERMATHDVMLKIYGAHLEAQFRIAAESLAFALWSIAN